MRAASVEGKRGYDQVYLQVPTWSAMGMFRLPAKPLDFYRLPKFTRARILPDPVGSKECHSDIGDKGRRCIIIVIEPETMAVQKQ